MRITLIILCLIGITIPIALLIGTFITFYNVNKIKSLLKEQNENIETLIKLEIRKEEQN